MVTFALIWLLGSVAELLASLLPPLPDPAGVVGSVSGGIAQVVGYVGSLAFWVPFDQAGMAVLVVAVVALAAGAIKLTRIILSFLTLGGGSAA